MDTFDWTVLALLATAIGAMLAFSRTARLVFVRSLLHPLTPGYIVTGEDGRVEFVESPPADEIDEDVEAYGQEAPQATGSTIPAGGGIATPAGSSGQARVSRNPGQGGQQPKTPERQAR